MDYELPTFIEMPSLNKFYECVTLSNCNGRPNCNGRRLTQILGS